MKRIFFPEIINHILNPVIEFNTGPDDPTLLVTELFTECISFFESTAANLVCSLDDYLLLIDMSRMYHRSSTFINIPFMLIVDHRDRTKRVLWMPRQKSSITRDIHVAVLLSKQVSAIATRSHVPNSEDRVDEIWE